MSAYAGGLVGSGQQLTLALDRINPNDPASYLVFFAFYFACIFTTG